MRIPRVPTASRIWEIERPDHHCKSQITPRKSSQRKFSTQLPATLTGSNIECSQGPQPLDLDDPLLSGMRVNVNYSNQVRLNGSNYTAWKATIAVALDAVPSALDVAKGTLLPPDEKTNLTPTEKLQQRRYDAGNRAARAILFNSLSTALAVSTFADDAYIVEAPEMCRDINARCTATSGGLKRFAISKLMQYRYQSNKTTSENIFRSNQITEHLATLGVAIPADLKITVLLQALASSWESSRQGFMARPDESRDIKCLIEAIHTEALRRGQFD